MDPSSPQRGFGRCSDNGSQSSIAPDCPNRGQLDLRRSKYLDCGNHSQVVLAPFALPPTTAAPSVRGAVAVKLATPGDSERDMLLHEAKIYNTFSRSLHEGCYSSGLPIVPKFYGYYVPSLGDLKCDNKLAEKEVDTIRGLIGRITPLLLLEPCGEQIAYHRLSSKHRWARFKHLEKKKEVRTPALRTGRK
jgi:hypothetical protein